MNVNESFIYTVLYQSLPTISWIGMVLIHVSPLVSMELHNPDFQNVGTAVQTWGRNNLSSG